METGKQKVLIEQQLKDQGFLPDEIEQEWIWSNSVSMGEKRELLSIVVTVKYVPKNL